ncbi:hypothetical protein [Psychrobacter sp. AOP7-B1-24]|uniref:hypothetical protein n=1 Tax=Psychrobacter sp. AOP7-B1-24 TaxID=3457645 RepID=UPI00402BEB73
MNKSITIFSILLLCNCTSNAQTEIKDDLSNTTDCSVESKCHEQLTKKQLEVILADISTPADTPLRHTYIDNIDGQNVLTDFTTLSNSTEYHYFIKKNNETESIDKIIGKSSVYGITRNFIVSNINENLTSDYREIADNILSEITKHHEIQQTGAFYKLPMQVRMGEIKKVNFFVRYNNDNEISNFDPKYVIQCANNKITLKDDTLFFIGYNYNNLEQETYAVLKDGLDKYTYYYDMNKLCSAII